MNVRDKKINQIRNRKTLKKYYLFTFPLLIKE